MPHDQDARWLTQQSFLLSEFLTEKVRGYEPPQLTRKAVVHGHCHHKVIMGLGPTNRCCAGWASTTRSYDASPLPATPAQRCTFCARVLAGHTARS
jgi:hypothetical protein